MNQNQQPNWTPVGAQSNNERWSPQKEVNYNPQNPGNIIMGYLKDITERPGNNGPFNVVEIATVNPGTRTLGSVFDVSGGKVLDDMLNKIDLGSFICIKYTGKARSKGGNTYNTWEVYRDDNAIPFQQLGGQAPSSAPVFNNQAPPPPVQQAPVFNKQAPAFSFSDSRTSAPQSAPQFQQPTFNPPPQTTQNQSPEQQPYIPPALIPPGQKDATFGGQQLPPDPFQRQGSGLPF